MDISEFISNTFKIAETKLSEKLELQNFYLSNSMIFPLDFGSRYCIWQNEKELIAIKLVWDGKKSLFSIEESPFTLNSEPISWADIVLIQLEQDKINEEYQRILVKNLLNEIK